MKNPKRIGLALMVAVPGAGLIVILLVSLLSAPRLNAGGLFERYILRPIPDSVTEIKVDQPVDFRGYAYVFKFHISSDDLGLILKARPFQEVSNVKYDPVAGLLWDWTPTDWVTMAVYADGQRAPGWFVPEQWHDPDGYAFEDRNSRPPNIQVLLHNAKLQQACFIVCSEFK